VVTFVQYDHDETRAKQPASINEDRAVATGPAGPDQCSGTYINFPQQYLTQALNHEQSNQPETTIKNDCLRLAASFSLCYSLGGNSR